MSFFRFLFREQSSSATSTRPFTSFSVKLSGIVHELHRCLLQALMAETSATTKTQILKVNIERNGWTKLFLYEKAPRIFGSILSTDKTFSQN